MIGPDEEAGPSGGAPRTKSVSPNIAQRKIQTPVRSHMLDHCVS
jgi:hypothetical protein